MIETYLKEIKKFPPFTKEDEKKVILKAKKGDRAAYEELMNRNLRFVVSVAKQYQNQGLSIDDLVSEGNMGLIHAFNKFDVKQNVKFITYAVWWIRQSILKAIHANADSIRLPVNIILKLQKIHKERAELEQILGRTLTFNELLEYSDDEDLTSVVKYSHGMVYIDEAYFDTTKDLHEIIPDPNLIQTRLTEEDIKEELLAILNDLTERERKILIMYFGVDQSRPFTLKEIGEDQGLTRERIRQIKEKTLGKLKDEEYQNRLKD